MCRIFGFRSVLDSHVHRSLASADNALAVQSSQHPDGWGVAYYVSGAPHVIRSAGTALSDHLFHRVSGVVTSQTVLAHVRKATQGDLHTLNCHPFQYGRWVMAHNGDVPAFADVRADLQAQVAPKLRRFVLGDTDSELLFHLFLTFLAADVDLDRAGTPLAAVTEALKRTVACVREVADGREGVDDALLTLVVTDGQVMAAHQGGRDLYWSTWKTRCPDRETCTFFAPECEAPTRSGYVNHLILSSEPLQGDNDWTLLGDGGMVGVDAFMKVWRGAA
ncbi:MAG: class II glutamine amidotransferase [Alphaproteobacteria bacterium]|nr:class II glutamine amidotransferase [Alphaproteobacteria bacterium]